MSAYMVSDKTINNIIQGAIDEGIIFAHEAQKAAKILIRANMFSLKTRYNDTDRSKLKEYKFLNHNYNENLTDHQVIQSCRVMNYQCSEYQSWSKSNARRLLTSITNSKLESLKMKDLDDWYNKRPELDWE